MRQGMAVAMAIALAAAGAALTAQSEEPSMVGKAAPEIQAGYWLNSGPLTLKELQGKIVVVEFWATWCPPCRQSIPHLNELNTKYGPKGVAIIGLTDEPKSKVEPFAKEMKMNYVIGGQSPTAKSYGVRGIPTAFLIDTSGVITWAGHPMNPAFEKAIEAQLEKTPPKMEPPTPKTRPKK